jgi:precorrin-4/cobalt-precorrin-4 C11-methyltransferase
VAQVYFIGAGPGDIELLTIKAKKIIEQADVIIYADSLISPEVCQFARHDARIYKSASLTLEETTGIIVKTVEQGKIVARLQSGDPSIYGAIGEQMMALDEKGIQYEVIPGVSSLFAAAASLKAELTMPEKSQTVIITRLEGRTPVPAPENLRSLAEHGATIALFLSVALAQEAVAELIQGGYTPDTPAALVYKASWKDEIIIRTTLDELPGHIKKSGIKKQGLILVGKFLDRSDKELRSKLYDGNFSHEYR